MSGYRGAQDTFYVGTLKGVGRVYQQSVIDTYAKVAFAKLYNRKTPITAAEILNDRVVPFYDEHAIRFSRMLTDRGTEFAAPKAMNTNSISRSRTSITAAPKTKSLQTNGICERFHRTVLDEFYRVAFRKKIYRSIAAGRSRCSSNTMIGDRIKGRWCCGKRKLFHRLDGWLVRRIWSHREAGPSTTPVWEAAGRRRRSIGLSAKASCAKICESTS